MQLVHRIILSAALASSSAITLAATTVYTSQAPFLAQLAPGAYTETFDGLSNTAVPPSTFSSGAFAYSISAPDGLYASGQFLGTNYPTQSLTITFTSGNVFAVGANFYATNVSDAFQPTSMTLTLSDNTTVSYTPTSTATYRGFTSTAKLTSLTISAPGTSLYAGLDNLTVGALPITAAVPEPSSMALMTVFGLMGLGIARKRQR